MLTCAEMLNSVKVYLIVKILDSVMSRLPSEHQKCMQSCYDVLSRGCTAVRMLLGQA